MKLIPFPENNIILAEDQPEYEPAPAYYAHGDSHGALTYCWKLSFMDRVSILFTGRIWHQILTFGLPVQPQLLTVKKPHMPPTASVNSRAGAR